MYSDTDGKTTKLDDGGILGIATPVLLNRLD